MRYVVVFASLLSSLLITLFAGQAFASYYSIHPTNCPSPNYKNCERTIGDNPNYVISARDGGYTLTAGGYQDQDIARITKDVHGNKLYVINDSTIYARDGTLGDLCGGAAPGANNVFNNYVVFRTRSQAKNVYGGYSAEGDASLTITC